MQTALLWIGLFWLTVAEVWVGTWEGRADRQSTSAKTSRYSWISAGWAGAFEILLVLDMWLVVREGWTIGIPIVVGAVWGKYHALEKRRAKWRGRVRRKKPK
jgi:hypothetical protein